MRRLAWGYAAALLGVTLLGWIPWLADADGRLFGVFRLTWYNDALHLASAAWAAGAALAGVRAARLFLRVFGGLYLLDGLMGLAIGSGYLDLGVLVHGVQALPIVFKLQANAPHLILGSVALFAGLAGKIRPGLRSAGMAMLLLAGWAGQVWAEPAAQFAESDSYLSYPEWSIVYAYEDFSDVASRRGESAFDYWDSIGGFWRSLHRVSGVAAAHGKAPLDERAMLAIIGVSFTGEMLAKGAYETTIGRLTETLRGPVPTAEDLYVHHVAADYAHFLHQVPWYRYPFLSRIGGLWRVPFSADHPIRAAERRFAMTTEWLLKSGYAQIMAAAAGLSPAELRIRSVVRVPATVRIDADPEIRVVGDLGHGVSLIETPRYEAYTAIVSRLAGQGCDFDTIAGNHAVLVTVLAPSGAAISVSGVRPIFQADLQSRPGWQRIGLDVPVAHLADLARAMTAVGVFEHVYDY